MALSDPNQHTPDPRPTGDLEHLFRQKFAEAEVSPRASLWEQLDHELLVQQNETYRRRLLSYRWAAAASLVLLAGGGTWLSLQPNAPARPGQLAATTARRSAAGAAAVGQPAGTYAVPGRLATAPRSVSSAAAATGAVAAGFGETELAAEAAASPANSSGETGSPVRYAGGIAALSQARTYAAAGGGRSLGLTTGTRSSLTGATLLEDGYTLAAAPGSPALAAPAWGVGAESLRGRTASLGGAASAARPEMLAELPAAPALLTVQAPAPEDPEVPARPARPRRWKLNAAYAAAAFHPNIDFTRQAASSSSTYSLDHMRSADDAYEVAAAEYRDKLQAGLGQRVTVGATYALNQHWSLGTGLSVAQQEATSATSWNFQDGRSATAAFYAPLPATTGNSIRPNPDMPLRNVRYRYRTASVPVQARYTTSARQGWSLYAKLGAAVNVLLGSRSELEGVPEATRTYSLTSADSPYRKVTASVRGGTGLRYQPAAATWSLALGPEAEAGLTTLNADPTARLLRQRRPYAVGVEASVEFGGTKAAPVMP